MSSPKAGSSHDCALRLQRDLSALTESAAQGVEAMPPKGNCDACTSAEIEAAICFMADINSP